MRDKLNFTTCRFTGGINQDPQSASLGRECADARNVWTPYGEIERRPGSEYLGNAFHIANDATWSTVVTATQMYKETSAGTTTNNTGGSLDISSLDVDGKIYVGFDTLPTAADNVICLLWDQTPSSTNSNATHFKLEYWNGYRWKVLPSWGTGTAGTTNKFLRHATEPNFSPPTDWATTTLAYGGAVYWLRFVLKNAAIDASCAIDDFPTLEGLTTQPNYMGVIQGMIGASNIMAILSGTTGSGYGHIGGFKNGVGGLGVAGQDERLVASGYTSQEPATYCTVDYTRKVYFTAPGGVFELSSSNIQPSGGYPEVEPAAVEDSDLIVGDSRVLGIPGIPYDKTLVPQQSAFPRCRYISYFQNRFWFAGVDGSPQIVQWGAGSPYQHVLPALNYEDIIENSAEPISGMAPLGANMVVYKPNSIHQMIYTGLSRNEEATFVPQTLVRGVGCVSNSSIADVQGSHVFLSARGLVRFDGRDAVYIAQGKSQVGGYYDRLQEVWPLLSRWQWSVGVHWEAKHCYLLACSYKGSATNNLVIVWDYVQDAFWLWDGMDVAGWFFEDPERRRLCYADSYGRLFALAGGNDFGTAIDSYVTTVALGQDQVMSSALRLIEVVGESTQGTMTTTFIRHGQTDKTGSLDWTDPSESVWDTGKWGTAKWAGDGTRYRRQSCWQIGREHQVKLSSSVKDTKFSVQSLKLGYAPRGKR